MAQMQTKRAKRVSIKRQQLEKAGYILVINNDKKCIYYTVLLKGRVKTVVKREKGAEGSVYIMKEDEPLIQCKRIRMFIREEHLTIECFSPERQLDFF